MAEDTQGTEAPPSQAELDRLFGEAREARVIEGGARDGRPLGRKVLARFTADELLVLRDALRVIETGPPFHCMCHGDLAIELRGRLLRVGVLSYHHGRSLRLEGAASDSELVDGPALLRLLAARGVPAPLARHQADQIEGERLAAAHASWNNSAPAVLRELLPALTAGPMGLPPPESAPVFDAAITALRGAGPDDRVIATRLLAWLGTSASPWSGYPAHESVPMVLLRRLDPSQVLAALLGVEGDIALLGAARFVADHQIVSFRKRLLRAIPDERFAVFEERLGRVVMSAAELDDARARLAAARAISAAARNRASELLMQRDRELACAAISEDGPFDSLVSDGRTLAALDVYTVVRIDPERGVLEPLTTYEGSPFTELLFSQGELIAVRGNEERIDRVPLDGGPRSVRVPRIARPLHPVDAGGVPCCISAPFEQRGENSLRHSVQRTSLVRIEGAQVVPIVAVEGGVACLAADATHLYFATTDLDRKGVLRRVSRDGGKPAELARVTGLGHAMAQPALVIAGSHALFADGARLCRVPVNGGRVETLHEAGSAIAAIAVVPEGFVLIVGGMSDESWDVLRIEAGSRQARRLGALRRRPFHRLRLVVCAGEAFFTLDDRLFRVRGPARSE